MCLNLTNVIQHDSLSAGQIAEVYLLNKISTYITLASENIVSCNVVSIPQPPRPPKIRDPGFQESQHFAGLQCHNMCASDLLFHLFILAEYSKNICGKQSGELCGFNVDFCIEIALSIYFFNVH